MVHRPPEEPVVQQELKRLADARLVITDNDVVELAHKVLIRVWPLLRIWDAATGKEQLKLTDHAGIVIGVAYCGDGARLATSSSDKTAKISDARTGQLVFTLAGHTKPITNIACSPDGLKVVTGSGDRTAKVWDAHTGKELLTLTGHSSEIQAVAFSADSRLIATGSGDNTAIIWDAVTGKELHTLPGNVGTVTGVAFDPRDSGRLVVASADGIVRVLLLNTDDQVALARSRITHTLTDWECQKFLHRAPGACSR